MYLRHRVPVWVCVFLHYDVCRGGSYARECVAYNQTYVAWLLDTFINLGLYCS